MKKRRLLGATMIEVLTASFMTVMVVTTAVATMLYGLSSWAKGQGRIYAETDTQKAIRLISMELREAMSVTVDGDGLGLSYRRPRFDSDGDYITPAEWDGVSRRIELVGSTLRISSDGQFRSICSGVVLTDPLTSGGTGTYRIFQAPAGAITRQITVQVVARRNTYKSMQSYSRSRETIFLRNVPELTK